MHMYISIIDCTKLSCKVTFLQGVDTYILLTKHEGRTGRISAQGLLKQYGPSAARSVQKDRGPIFSQYGPEQAWLIRDLLYD